MILSFLFFLFLSYVLYKLVVDFVIPIYRTTRRVKKSFREMQQKMQEQQQNGGAGYNGAPAEKMKEGREPLGDYIDFEEVKE
jgi:hypothetical protein